MVDENKILTDSFFVFCIDVTSGMASWLEQAKKEIIAILENYDKSVLAGDYPGDGPRNFKSRVVKFKFIVFDDKKIEHSRVFDLDDSKKPWLEYVDSIKIKSYAEASDAISAIYQATLDVNRAHGDLNDCRYLYSNLAVRGAVAVFSNSELVSPQSVKSDDGTSCSLCDLIQTEWVNNGPEGKTLRSKSRKILFLRFFDKDMTKTPYCKLFELLVCSVVGKRDYSEDNAICREFVDSLFWCD